MFKCVIIFIIFISAITTATIFQHQLFRKLSKNIIITENIKHFENNYILNITVGTPGQRFYVYLDVTSPRFWIPNKKCHGCQRNPEFDSKKSKTYIKVPDSQWILNYGEGSFEIEGVFGKDTVQFYNGNTSIFRIPKMMFGQAYKIPSGCENMNICGTLGIGMHDDTGEFPPSILYKAFKEKIIQKPIFSVYLEPKSGGENGVLTYGGYDERHCDITKIDTYNFSSSTQYQIQMKSFSFGAKRFFGNWDTFLSPGKAVIWGPPDIINALLQSVNASNNIVQLHFIDCNAKLDPIKLSFDGGKEEYIIEERQQKMPWPYAPPGLCLFPFNSADGDYWILGDPWHRSYCNFFNFGKAKTLGIAKPKI